MSCTYEEDLTAYLDRELPDLRARQLEAHLPACAECPATLALLEGAFDKLAALPQVEASAGLRRSVLHRIEEPASFWERVNGMFRPAVLAPALGLGAAAVAAVIWANTQHRMDLVAVAELDGDPQQLELAANLDVLEDLDVVGMESPDDLDVIANLDQLEGTP
jgi:anti-sigma factor RsiW